MQITIYRQAGASDDSIVIADDTITINGQSIDLSSIEIGGQGEWEDPNNDSRFVGPITRDQNGELHFGLIVRFSPETAEPVQGNTNPTVQVVAGPLPDVVVRKS